MSEGRVTVSVVQITQETQTEGLMVGKSTDFRLPGADYSQTCAALLAAKFEEFDMGAKQVTVSWVWVQEDTREEGITVHKSTDFRLPGADYSQTCAALLAAKFELVDTVQEAIDAKIAEGCEEKRMSEKRVTVSPVRITQETRSEGRVTHETTYFRLPGADYSQMCAALLAAKFELVDTVYRERLMPELTEGRNE